MTSSPFLQKLSAGLAESLTSFLLALGGQVLYLLPLRLAALSIRICVLFVSTAVAAPTLARIQLCLRHGASFLLTLASYPRTIGFMPKTNWPPPLSSLASG
jgi:hypothetical protein